MTFSMGHSWLVPDGSVAQPSNTWFSVCCSRFSALSETLHLPQLHLYRSSTGNYCMLYAYCNNSSSIADQFHQDQTCIHFNIYYHVKHSELSWQKWGANSKLLYSVKQITTLPVQEFSMYFVKYSRYKEWTKKSITYVHHMCRLTSRTSTVPFSSNLLNARRHGDIKIGLYYKHNIMICCKAALKQCALWNKFDLT